MLGRSAAAVVRSARAAWRRYLRTPRLVRWPLTAVVLVIVAVLIANLAGAARVVETREIAIEPGATAEMTVQVQAGRNVEVTWRPAGAGGADDQVVFLDARLVGPALELAVDEPAVAGAFRFKGGFTTARYTIELTNKSARQSGLVAVRWTIR